MIAALLLSVAGWVPRIEIVAANDTTVTYRELIPQRVALDPLTHTFHYKGCPEIRTGLEWVAPAAATLRHYTEHSCVALRRDEHSVQTDQRAPRDPAHIAVLFLGNSLTYFNEMPRMTSAIGAHEARPLRVDAVTMSGATLEDLWFRTEALKRIWQDHWDFVVLQERGGSGAHDQGEHFHRYLGKFADEARKSGATPLLFMTWYERYPAEQEAFMRAAARRARVQLLPVALAWKHDFDWDGIHPNLAGSYLIACLLYSVVYDRSALGTPFDFRDLAVKNEFYDKPLLEQSLNEEQARAIQIAAWNAVKNR